MGTIGNWKGNLDRSSLNAINISSLQEDFTIPQNEDRKQPIAWAQLNCGGDINM